MLIPLTFGAGSDWCRNVLAAGGCKIIWRGREYTTDEPQLVQDIVVQADLNAAFGPLTRLQLQAMGTHQFLRLRIQLMRDTHARMAWSPDTMTRARPPGPVVPCA